MKNPIIKTYQIDPSLSYVDASEDQLISLWRAYYPAGSGPLGAMRTVCALIESLAKLRGFDPSKWTRYAVSSMDAD